MKAATNHGRTTAPTTFRDLHHRDRAFVIPNPWDVGSARMLATMGFEALATTSAGFAFSLGLKEGELCPEIVLAHCHEIVNSHPPSRFGGSGEGIRRYA